MATNAQVGLTVMLFMLAPPAAGEDLNLRAGLWEVSIVSDFSNFMPADQKARMEKAFAQMTPQQRAQAEAAMKNYQANAGKPSITKACMTREGIAKMSTVNPPGRDSTCRRTDLKATSNVREFHEECSAEDGKKTGATVHVSAPNPETYLVEWTADPGSNVDAKFRISAKWLNADCGNVKP
jgi:hypothetical protein